MIVIETEVELSLDEPDSRVVGNRHELVVVLELGGDGITVGGGGLVNHMTLEMVLILDLLLMQDMAG
ncbi:hypothetical protein C5167_010366 [Papaver somniferum]|uniref:Uncharacterized protein n=1 Tax=Papaver somniferum TaxID=3469 RepID=A0A4Y7K1E4_PAPSO|nr:hypothetical protein C5167_010366 [Papaver somniferum]